MIRAGVPAVALVHEPFARLARMQVQRVGLAETPLLIYPRDLADRETRDMLREKARDVAEKAAGMILDLELEQ